MADHLPTGKCHVWWARPTDANPLLQVLLDTDEHQRWTALRRADDRDRFLVGCAMTRLALARYLDQAPDQIAIDRACEWCARPHGKPRLANAPAPRIEWSVSHSGERVGVAFTFGVPVGLDVEQCRPDVSIEELAPEVLTPPELGVFATIPSQRRVAAFFTYWTRKEAVAKATGRGLTLPLNTFEVSEPTTDARLVTSPWDSSLAASVTMHDLSLDAEYAACVALIGERSERSERSECSRVMTRDGSALLRQTSRPPDAYL